MMSSFRPVQKDIELVQPPGDSVSKIAFSPTQDILGVASWDNIVRLYNVNSQGQSEPKAMYQHEAPVLDLTWTKAQQVAAHDAPIKCARFVETNGNSILITAGWDKKLKVHIYDLANPFTKYRQIESPLKWQTRVISCFPQSVGGDGYAIGSIEGRIGIQKNFSFKCHRIDIPTGSMPGSPAVTGSQNVFPINTISFHQTQGTFCTGGGDGSLTFWDGMAPYSAKDLGNGDPEARPNPVWGTPVVSTAFNHTQEILAYAFSYDWSKGHGGVPPANPPATKIMLHPVKPEEVNRKKK
ncbi:hypothetical protein A1Q2_06918 [Trichosporon asahii var. asahii CBS 8904]|uniref:Uncharacterized protein n=2 Tax=Trichosporon asahii var. asahii TaxID=189963 RepID=K1VDC4_TRIAC|nr:hypothetical protein A1Q1_06255 [Trichosporon asahii var. asahii CBS 2479]EJT52149.1 hypothetical protein A1Q1_06255 [Trichosporon asahii var. asahii CBS 2479]EKC98815.1 hypothetical protein A1Q2_06918 [Trichosporon asahii var. asahii CBS 8904]